ncbi:MAG TPA: SrtB family sortase [Lachnospiraceae bacterium]|nr:SrtB family sortase [Lachnospiraceae bacterium]
MAGKVFIVEGRSFRTESDYALAKRDKETIDRLRSRTNLQDKAELEALQKELRGKKYHFHTLLGQDFLEEVEDLLKKAELSEEGGRQRGKKAKQAGSSTKRTQEGSRGRRVTGKGLRESAAASVSSDNITDAAMEAIVQEELRKRERRRKLTIILCSLLGVGCLSYFGVYSYYNYRTNKTYQQLSELKEKPVIAAADSNPAATAGPKEPLFTLDDEVEEKEVLDEYKNLLLTNRKLIGWVKIEGTYIDYPVMQTTDNEYYLDHNLNQEYDKNGTIFMDKDCDVLKPSTNYILYGHHMKNGRMFGQLDKYQKESYYEEHPYISFDTIYEKGTYQVMYVFRSKVYKEAEIVFKYYQFIDANSEQEFNSYMKEMADMSFYDTGVTAEYGDQLLTLSTCDYQETDGRFVVVAKKVEE